MASAGQSPQKLNVMSDEPNVTKKQLRRDRINLGLVILVFGVLIGLMIWLASMGPPAGEYNYTYPLVP